jgi:hypothetical protein
MRGAGEYLDSHRIEQGLTQKSVASTPRRDIKLGTQIGTQKCAERAVEAVDAVHAVRIFLRKFSAR